VMADRKERKMYFPDRHAKVKPGGKALKRMAARRQTTIGMRT